MNRRFQILSAVVLGWSSFASAQTTSSTPPIGFIRKDCPANSDTRISIPLERQASYIGPVQSVSSNVITVQGSPGWSPDQFKFAAGSQEETYYVLFLTGAKEGRNFDITANGVNTLTVDLSDDDLSGVTASDRIKVLPHWTLNAAFPSGSGIEASPNGFQRTSELLVQDGETQGINLASINTFYYSGTWKGISDLVADAGKEILPPHKPLVVRNKDTATSAVFVGVVPSDVQTVALRVPAGDSSVKQDNPVALLRPIPVKLDDSGLDEAVFKTSTLPVLRTDEILVYDDSEAGVNKSAKFTYYKYAGAWRRLDQPANYDAGNEEIFTPGTGVIIRKAGVGAGSEQTVYWKHEDPTQQ